MVAQVCLLKSLEKILSWIYACVHTHVQQRHTEVRGQSLVLFLRNTSTFLFETGPAPHWPAGKLLSFAR